VQQHDGDEPLGNGLPLHCQSRRTSASSAHRSVGAEADRASLGGEMTTRTEHLTEEEPMPPKRPLSRAALRTVAGAVQFDV